jgi:hypothetical protein
MLFTTYDGWHQNFAGLALNLPFATATITNPISPGSRNIRASTTRRWRSPPARSRRLRAALLGARRP